jgi:cysteine synthase A
MNITDDVTHEIGDTPLIRLDKVSDCGADILGKAEYLNPGGSVKDRIGKAMIEDACASDLIDDETLIVEPTSGNTGIALAMVAAAKDLNLVLTMPDRMSLERRSLLKGLGADVVLTPGSQGMQGAVNRAEAIVNEHENSLMLHQFHNEANPQIHAETTGEEIWSDTDGEIAAIVTGVGTGGTITGVSRTIKEKNPAFQAIAVEPEESPVLSGGEPRRHRIQGIGAGFWPEVYDDSVVDEIVTVDYETAREMSRRLAAEEGIFVGVSAGANVAAAIEVGRRSEFDGEMIVTTLCDTGERYLSTPLYRGE